MIILYCFETIEITKKWKLKKQINYTFFYECMENIYDEIFCSNSSTFNNKIIAASSLGNIIEKTINYNVENEIERVLNKYLKCVISKKTYIANNDLTLLRGNLYCQIYTTLKNNVEINNNFDVLLDKVNKSFDYIKYTKNAKVFFNNSLNKVNLSYMELNNYLTFNAYNGYNLDKDDLIKIMSILIQKFANDYFDKKVFIYLFKEICNGYLNQNNINEEIEILFEDSDDNANLLFLNYNCVDCNVTNNLDVLKKLFYRIVRINYEKLNVNREYIELLKIKDELIHKKEKSNLSIINSENFFNYVGMEELNKYLNQQKFQSYDDFILQLVETKKNKIEKNDCFYFSNNEIFEELYDLNDIKKFCKEYSILSYEYDENGKYKSISKIIQDKSDALLNLKDNDEELKKKEFIYNNIIKYRNCELYSLLNDYYSLLLIDSVDSNLLKEKELALKEILPNLVNMSLLHYEMTDEKKKQIFDEYIEPCIKKISQNRVNNKAFDSTKDFLNYEKSNADNYFGICKLQDILNKEQKNEF